MRPGQIAGPIVVIGIGCLFLLNNLGWHLPIGNLISRFWPLILIGVGLAHIAGALAGRGSLPGGILFTTVGVLFLLQQLWDIRFGDTWPVLIIVAGASALLKAVAGPTGTGQGEMRWGGRR